MKKPQLLLAVLLACCVLVIGWLLHQRSQPKPTFRFEAGPKSSVTSLAYSPDGETLACAFAIEKGRRTNAEGNLVFWTPAEVRLYDAATGEHLKSFFANSGAVYELTFSRDGSILRAQDDAGRRWWAVGDAKLMRQTQVPAKSFAIAFSLDGKLWADCREEDESAVVVRHADTNSIVRGFPRCPGNAYFAAFSPDGNSLAVAYDEYNVTGKDDVLRVWNVVSGQLRAQLRCHRGMRWMGFLDNQRIIKLSHGSSIELWNIGDKTVQSLERFPFETFGGALSPDTRFLVGMGRKLIPNGWHQLRDFWDYESEFDPSANFGRAAIREITTAKSICEVTAGKRIRIVALAPNGKQWAVATDDALDRNEPIPGHIEVWPIQESASTTR